MKLLTAVWTGNDRHLGRPYLAAGCELWRDDVAGLLCDHVLPPGTLLEEDGITWRVFYEDQRGALVSSGGDVLWAAEDGNVGYTRLVKTDWFVRGWRLLREGDVGAGGVTFTAR